MEILENTGAYELAVTSMSHSSSAGGTSAGNWLKKIPIDTILASGQSIAQLAQMLKENHIDKLELIKQLKEIYDDKSAGSS
jgi:hypothetical protein